jgi:hypothetical protein
MMSKESYFTDNGNRIFCHLMYDLPRIDGAVWGANQVGSPSLFDGSPIFSQQLDPAPVTEFYVAMGTCSDGTTANADGNSADHSHTHLNCSHECTNGPNVGGGNLICEIFKVVAMPA